MSANTSFPIIEAEQAFQRADFVTAERIYQEALRQQERTLGLKRIEVALTSHTIGSLYYSIADYFHSQKSYERAKDIFEELLGANHPHVAITLRKLAKISQLRGEDSDADRLYGRSLEIWLSYVNSIDPDFQNRSNDFNAQFDQPKLEEKVKSLPKILKNCQTESSLYGIPFCTIALYEVGVLYKNRQHYKIAQELLGYALEEISLKGSENLLFSASILEHLAELSLYLGDTTNAAHLCQEALTILSKYNMQEHPKSATVLQLLAKTALASGIFKESEELYTKSLHLIDKTLGSQSPCKIQALKHLGHLHARSQNYLQAENNYKDAIKILVNAFGETHIGVIKIENDLARLYLEQNKFDQAEALSIQSIDKAGTWDSTEPQVLASLYDSLASIYRAKEQYIKAEFALRRAVQIRQKMSLCPKEALSEAMINQSRFYLDWGKYAEAEKYYKASLALIENINLEHHRLLAVCLEGLGAIYCKQALWKEAATTLGKALNVIEDDKEAKKTRTLVYEEDSPLNHSLSYSIETTLINLAELSIVGNNVQEADGRYKEAIANIESSSSNDTPKIARVLNLRAELALKQNCLDEARALFEKSIQLIQSSSKPDYAELSTAFCGLGDVCDKQTLKDEAAIWFSKALSLTEQKSALNTCGVITTFNKLAKHCQTIGDTGAVMTYLKQALSLGKQVLGRSHPIVASTQLQIADFYAHEKQMSESAEFYIRAMQTMDATFGSVHPNLVPALTGLARCYIAQENEIGAKPLLERSKRIQEYCLSSSTSSRTN